MNVGSPAGGVNSALRTAVRLAISRGHTVLGCGLCISWPHACGFRSQTTSSIWSRPGTSIHNGFDGLLAGQITELDWMSVQEWASKGGSRLGKRTWRNRELNKAICSRCL